MKANNMKLTSISRKITLEVQGEKGMVTPSIPDSSNGLVPVTAVSELKKRCDLSVGRYSYTPKFIISESGSYGYFSAFRKSGRAFCIVSVLLSGTFILC